MQELAIRKRKAMISEVRLRLLGTDIPADALPRGEKGEYLIIPTDARLLLRNEGIRIEMIVVDPETSGNQFYDRPTFDDENPPIIPLDLDKGDILRLTIGGFTFRNRHPTAVVVINDPGEIVDELRLTFASTDPNNPNYAIKALAKMLGERLGIAIEEMEKHERSVIDNDIPF